MLLWLLGSIIVIDCTLKKKSQILKMPQIKFSIINAGSLETHQFSVEIIALLTMSTLSKT